MAFRPSVAMTRTDSGLSADEPPPSGQSPDSERGRSLRAAGTHTPRPAASPFRIALACAVTLAVALGVGRFAFTPLLPVMLHEGLVDIRGGGWLASFNYAGYFIGAATCAVLRVDPARMIRFGLVATVVLTIAMGMVDMLLVWAVLRTVAGIVSAWTFVFASQWGMRRLAESNALHWGGLIYTGPGAGIVVTGLAAGLVARGGAASGWIGFGVLSAVLSALVWRYFGRPASAAAPAAASAAPASGAHRTATAPARRAQSTRFDAISLSALYGLAGFGYIITATFLPVIARQALPGSPWPDLFWPLLGVATIPGALLGARLPQRWDNRASLAVCYLVQAAGIGLGVIAPSVVGFAVGSALIGLPFTAITMFAMREAWRLHGERAAGLMGYATAVYGAGQIAGPLVAAPIAARTGSFSPALELALGVLVVGAALLLVLARRRRGAA